MGQMELGVREQILNCAHRWFFQFPVSESLRRIDEQTPNCTSVLVVTKGEAVETMSFLSRQYRKILI